MSGLTGFAFSSLVRGSRRHEPVFQITGLTKSYRSTDVEVLEMCACSFPKAVARLASNTTKQSSRWALVVL
jgi:hypothetical protein